MLLGTWGCVIDSIAVVLKSFLPNSQRLWPLYTLFILVGWTIYAPAQLLVLYSRLHLVNRNRNLQRRILIMIVAVASLMIIPTWSLVWQAYDPYNPRLSALYSPREAIVDRCTQLGYTIAENIIGGIYIWSLVKLLNLKSSVRQRRVMIDLIYVNVIAVALDILTVALVFLNQTGISHPIQTFSYILKLKLEFLVLNQLMAVAARGIRPETFAERRYHHPSSTSSSGEKGASLSAASGETSRRGPNPRSEPLKLDPAREPVAPPPTLPKAQRTPDGSALRAPRDHRSNGGRWPGKATVEKKRGTERADRDAEEDEEIGLHMWENGGKWVMEVPWFQTEGPRLK